MLQNKPKKKEASVGSLSGYDWTDDPQHTAILGDRLGDALWHIVSAPDPLQLSEERALECLSERVCRSTLMAWLVVPRLTALLASLGAAPRSAVIVTVRLLELPAAHRPKLGFLFFCPSSATPLGKKGGNWNNKW